MVLIMQSKEERKAINTQAFAVVDEVYRSTPYQLFPHQIHDFSYDLLQSNVELGSIQQEEADLIFSAITRIWQLPERSERHQRPPYRYR